VVALFDDRTDGALVELLAPLHELGVPLDRGQGVAKLVADQRDELLLHPLERSTFGDVQGGAGDADQAAGAVAERLSRQLPAAGRAGVVACIAGQIDLPLGAFAALQGQALERHGGFGDVWPEQLGVRLAEQRVRGEPGERFAGPGVA
jgi:hypothetical protein